MRLVHKRLVRMCLKRTEMLRKFSFAARRQMLRLKSRAFTGPEKGQSVLEHIDDDHRSEELWSSSMFKHR